MVIKKNSNRNPKPASGDQKPKPDKQSSKEDSLPAIFKELNDPLYRKGYLAPDAVYEFYIVSRVWLRKFRRSAKNDDLQDIGAINADLMAVNTYGFDSQKIERAAEHVLKNNLIIDDDYEAVTDEAWNFLTTVAGHITIRKSFYVDADFEFTDMDDSLFVNVVFINKEKEVLKQMLCMNKPRKLEAFYATVYSHYQMETEKVSLLLFDSRKTVKELDTAIKDSVILGKLIDTSAYFPFNKLKDHDILILCANPDNYALDDKLDENEGGFCYNCRDCTNLDYHCSCKIVSYCSIECKYSDLLYHKAFCDKISNYTTDVFNDISNVKTNQTNEGLTGLVNIGNSCYLNCLLQALKYNDIIKTHLSTRDGSFIAEQGAFVSAIYHFFYLMWHTKRRSIRPWFLKIAIGLKHKDYLYFAQNDAHECLMNLIDDINEVSDPMYKAIADMYKGKLVSRIKCTSCPKEIAKVENFYSLSLPLIEEKLKTKVPVNRLASDEYLKMSAYECIVSNTTRLGELGGNTNAVLYLADQDKIAYVLDNKDDELAKILNEAKEVRNQESIFVLQNFEKANGAYLGLSFTETKPTTNKFFDMKAKICRMRLLPVEAKELEEPGHLIGQDVKASVLKYLLSLPNPQKFTKELDYLNSGNKLVSLKVAAKMLGYEAFIEPVAKPLYPKKHHYKLEKQTSDNIKKSLDGKSDEFEYDKESYNSAISKYEVVYKSYIEFEKNAALADEIANSVELLPVEYQFEVYYINKGDTCQNCGKKMKHQCKLRANQKLVLQANRLLEINIEFPKGSVIAQQIKAITSYESDIKGLNLSNKKAELSLRSCLDGFFSPEQIEFKCEACSSSHSVIQTEIDSYPDTLIIQFKRFATVFKDNKVKQVKNEQFVDYDFTLEFENHVYDLASVVNHKGEINHGHYTSYALNTCTNAWTLYDDDEVRELTNPAQLKTKENYLLFFKQRSSNG